MGCFGTYLLRHVVVVNHPPDGGVCRPRGLDGRLHHLRHLHAVPDDGLRRIHSLVKFRRFGIGFESDFGKFVQNSVANPFRFDEIWPKSEFELDK